MRSRSDAIHSFELITESIADKVAGGSDVQIASNRASAANARLRASVQALMALEWRCPMQLHSGRRPRSRFTSTVPEKTPRSTRAATDPSQAVESGMSIAATTNSAIGSASAPTRA